MNKALLRLSSDFTCACWQRVIPGRKRSADIGEGKIGGDEMKHKKYSYMLFQFRDDLFNSSEANFKLTNVVCFIRGTIFLAYNYIVLFDVCN